MIRTQVCHLPILIMYQLLSYFSDKSYLLIILQATAVLFFSSDSDYFITYPKIVALFISSG